LGFAGLWFLYERRRENFLKGFLIPCWLVFFIVYAACLYWLLEYKFWVYFLGTLALSLIFPFFFFIYHLIAQKFRSVVLNVITAFGIFCLLGFFLSSTPVAGTAPVDFFFNAPVEMLRILHFVDFRIWCAWLMATCFAAGFLMHKHSLKTLVVFCASLIAMGILTGLANMDMRSGKSGPRHSMKIALVQHNLPFSEEWRIDHPDEVKKKYEMLAMEAAKQHPDLVIFPQYTFPEDIYRKPDFFAGLARKTGVYILTGAHVPIETGKSILDFGFMNLALLFTPEGELGGIYQAMASAPFGEVSQLSAKKYQVIQTPFGKLGILLCYEDVTSRIPEEAVKSGAEILVALSNPGLFVNTPLPYYYFQQDQLRVMETGLPLARVSPNGYSAFIDKTGCVLQKSRLNTEEILYIDYSLK